MKAKFIFFISLTFSFPLWAQMSQQEYREFLLRSSDDQLVNAAYSGIGTCKLVPSFIYGRSVLKLATKHPSKTNNKTNIGNGYPLERNVHTKFNRARGIVPNPLLLSLHPELFRSTEYNLFTKGSEQQNAALMIKSALGDGSCGVLSVPKTQSVNVSSSGMGDIKFFLNNGNLSCASKAHGFRFFNHAKCAYETKEVLLSENFCQNLLIRARRKGEVEVAKSIPEEFRETTQIKKLPPSVVASAEAAALKQDPDSVIPSALEPTQEDLQDPDKSVNKIKAYLDHVHSLSSYDQIDAPTGQSEFIKELQDTIKSKNPSPEEVTKIKQPHPMVLSADLTDLLEEQMEPVKVIAPKKFGGGKYVAACAIQEVYEVSAGLD
jgi:hypothetical protein